MPAQAPATSSQAPAAQAPAAPAKAPASGPATFIGDKACLDCHEGWDRGVNGSPHARATDPRTPAAAQGCETCHGAGSKHSDDPAGFPVKIFAKMAPDAVHKWLVATDEMTPRRKWTIPPSRAIPSRSPAAR